MDRLPPQYTGSIQGDAFDAAAFPTDMIDEISAQMPLQSRAVFAQVSSAFASNVAIPGQIATLFSALKVAESDEALVEVFNTIPAVPPHMYAAIVREFFARVLEKASYTDDEILIKGDAAIVETEGLLNAETSEVRKWAGKRDLLIAKIFISANRYSPWNRRPLPIFNEEMRRLPKWCWPDVIMASEKGLAFKEATFGCAQYAELGLPVKPYSNDVDVLSVYDDQLEGTGGGVSPVFRGRLASACLHRAEAVDVCHTLMAKLGLGDDQRDVLEWSLVDAIRRRVVQGEISVSDLCCKWEKGNTSLYSKLQRKLESDAYLYRTSYYSGKLFLKESDLLMPPESGIFE